MMMEIALVALVGSASALSLQNHPDAKAQKVQLMNNAVVHGMAFDGTDWMSVGLETANIVAKPRWEPAGACNVAPPHGSKFFSQRSEDVDLYNNYFCNKRGGTFVEMGALDGVRFSNTKFFEDSMGWSGALIEAAPQSVQLLKTNRNNSTNRIFAEGVCPEGQNTMDFMVGSQPAVNGNPDDMADSFKKRWHRSKSDAKIVTVPCRPLDSMLKEFLSHSGADHIDFFSLDVEGGELSVMQTFNFDVLVHVFIIELDGRNPEKDESVRQLLQKQGFVKSDKKFRSSWANEIWVHPDALA